ncbi:hypothetical protein [Hyphomicrobium sp.]|uniref:hypothetical protein n=1 Tax=Hyphomicrobium sp. TaxID=82 RepID=UPI002E35FEB3|nr:hypothetical protein [Hyphomicrobium sp.]HEX2841384.1 hypothetical protein [Hyphomicrobium sp.]
MTRSPKDTPVPEGLTAVAHNVLSLLQRQWFDGRFKREEAVYLVPLLLSAYVAADEGNPINKKTASAAMGADDIKTARKYVVLAEKQGLLRSAPDEHDRRRELLYPTDALKQLLRLELAQIRDNFGQPSERDSDFDKAAESQIFVPPALTHMLAQGKIPLMGEVSFGAGGSEVRLVGPNNPANSRAANFEPELVQELLFPSAENVKLIPGAHHLHYVGKIHPDDGEAAEILAALCTQMAAVEPIIDPGRSSLETFDGSLVLLGGPTSNAVTALLLEVTQKNPQRDAFASPIDPVVKLRYRPLSDWKAPWVKITDTDWEPVWGVEDAKTQEILRPQVDTNDRLVTDFLVVTVMPNFLNPAALARGDRIVIFDGVHGVSTRANGLLFQNARMLKDLIARSKGSRSWQAVLTVSDIDYSGKRPRARKLETAPLYSTFELDLR